MCGYSKKFCYINLLSNFYASLRCQETYKTISMLEIYHFLQASH